MLNAGCLFLDERLREIFFLSCRGHPKLTRRRIMSNKKVATLSFTVALALAGVVALLWLPALSKVEGLGGSQVVLAQAGTGVIRVATTGSDTPGCGGATPCQTVQYAVD
jgi:hypothetical protein